MSRNAFSKTLATLGLVALVGATAACSTEVELASDGGLPAVIALSAVQDLSGTAGPGGVSTQQGMQIAIDEINDTKFLEGTTLTLSFQDAAGDPTKAANAMSQAAATDSPLLFGPFSSGSALGAAPVAQRAGVAAIFTQAGAAGVTGAGDRIYRATPLQSQYFNITMQFLRDQKIKTASVIYDTDVPTIVDLYNLFTSSAEDYGYKVVAPQATTSGTVDVSSQITKMLEENPDAIFVDALLAHNIQIIKQLRQSGYEGLIVAQQGAGGGVLAPIGDDANGVTLATDFNAATDLPEVKNFVALYEAAYGKVPGNFAAEGYDAVWLAARALKAADSMDRTLVLKALKQVTTDGYTGALGEITWDGRQMVTPGVLVQINKGVEAPVK